MNKIEIYTGPDCAYCEQAKALLLNRGISFEERDVGRTEVFEEFRSRLPRVKALPQIFVDGEHLGSLEDLRHYLNAG